MRSALYSLRSSEESLVTGVAILIGIGAGLGAVLFRLLIDGFHRAFFDGGAAVLGFMGDAYVIVLPALGGLIIGPLIYLFAREAKGHGVPEVMSAVATRHGRIRPRVSVVKSLASSICIGSGGSVGREGPIVQIGASLGSTIGQRLNLSREWTKIFVACGAAGGIAGTFNAPIAGIFFAMEIILRRYSARSFGLVVLSSVIAAFVARALLGDEVLFAIPSYDLVSSWEIPLYVLLGIVAAAVAHTFTGILYGAEDLFDRLTLPEWFKPAVGGLGIGLAGLFYPELFGVGYPAIQRVLEGDTTIGLLVALLGLKFVATSLTLGSGGSGGVFAPSLFLGAMMGGLFGYGMNAAFPGQTAPMGAYALVGMAAVFAGGARAPLTAIIILFELTRNYEIIIPLTLAVTVSTLVARALRRDSIYTVKIRRAGVVIPEEEIEHVLDEVPVAQAMSRDFPVVNASAPVSKVADLIAETGHRGFPVVDEVGQLVGVVTMADLQQARSRRTAHRVGEIATKQVVVAYPDQTVHDAVGNLGDLDVGRIPVVTRNGERKLLGVLRRHDIVRAYAAATNGHENGHHANGAKAGNRPSRTVAHS